ncbi:MAG: hypothetical protein U1F25_16665 [Rubrivivax sp.]
MMQANSKQARRARHWLAAAALGTAAMLGTTAARAEPLLHVEAGLLTGASGVLVNGTAYDVTFSDGSCNSRAGAQLHAVHLQQPRRRGCGGAGAARPGLHRRLRLDAEPDPRPHRREQSARCRRSTGPIPAASPITTWPPRPTRPWKRATAPLPRASSAPSSTPRLIPAVTIACGPPRRLSPSHRRLPLALAGLGLLWASRRRKQKQPR